MSNDKQPRIVVFLQNTITLPPLPGEAKHFSTEQVPPVSQRQHSASPKRAKLASEKPVFQDDYRQEGRAINQIISEFKSQQDIATDVLLKELGTVINKQKDDVQGQIVVNIMIVDALIVNGMGRHAGYYLATASKKLSDSLNLPNFNDKWKSILLHFKNVASVVDNKYLPDIYNGLSQSMLIDIEMIKLHASVIDHIVNHNQEDVSQKSALFRYKIMEYSAEVYLSTIDKVTEIPIKNTLYLAAKKKLTEALQYSAILGDFDKFVVYRQLGLIKRHLPHENWGSGQESQFEEQAIKHAITFIRENIDNAHEPEVKNHLGYSYLHLACFYNAKTDIPRAIVAYDKVIEYYTSLQQENSDPTMQKKDYDIEAHMYQILFYLGEAYKGRAELSDDIEIKTDNYLNSVIAFSNALKYALSQHTAVLFAKRAAVFDEFGSCFGKIPREASTNQDAHKISDPDVSDVMESLGDNIDT